MPTPRADVAHLLRRTNFGGSPAQIDALAAQDLTTIVDGLLALSGAPADTPPSTMKNAAFEQWEQYDSWRLWWYNRMVTSATPLQEKMTLFWHGHLTTQYSKIGRADIMYEQNKTLRANALGNFRTMLQAISVGPAMLQYLDNFTNRVGDVQENFARELWELFTLGVDQYTQADIVESARAWTGHSLNPWVSNTSGEDVYTFKPTWHDNGNKTIFGTTRNFNGPEVIDFTLDGPKKNVCANYMARRLWSYFAYPNGEQSVIDALAAVWISSNWDIKAVMRALLLRPEFYSEKAKTGLLRTPADYVVAATRYAGLRIARDDRADDPDAVHPNWYDEGMGMEIGEPPDVSGWKANSYWISAST
ncbi:MAG: DUF1800 family protein, partial [Acidimicrobiia bacterium]